MIALIIIGIVLVITLIFLYSVIIVGSRADEQAERYYKKTQENDSDKLTLK